MMKKEHYKDVHSGGKTRIKYDKLIEILENHIQVSKLKDIPASTIIDQVHKKLLDTIILRPEDFGNYISVTMIKAYDNINGDNPVAPEQIIQLVQKCLKYNPYVSYRKQICNVFTLIEYWKNSQKFEYIKQNWNSLMKKNR